MAQDTMDYPNDSLIYRWWNRYNLYRTLVNRDSLWSDSTLIAFLDDYMENEAVPKLDSIRHDIAIFASGEFDNEEYNELSTRLSNISTNNLMESNIKNYTNKYLETTKYGNTSELVSQIESISEYGL